MNCVIRNAYALSDSRFEVFLAVLKIHGFWDVAWFRLVVTEDTEDLAAFMFRVSVDFLDPDDEGHNLVRNIGKY
jgi:hypothetical protein